MKRASACLALILTLVPLVPARAQPPDPRFGAVEAFFAPFAADEAGVGWERVLFYWREIQPRPDVWRDDYFPPEILQRELSAGREIVGLLINPPGWANSNRGDRGVPDGLYLPYNHPDNHWGQFVSRIVAQYRGVIRHWILWNEPDVWDTSHFGYTWDGSVEEFAQLTKVGYLAAKDANPDCVVHLAGLTYWWDVEYGRQPYLERLLDALSQDAEAASYGFYFDVASLHIYFKPRTIPDIIAKTREAMRKHGLDKPIWLDETNAPPCDDPAHPIAHPRFPVTLAQQRDFLVQAFALALSAGAERVAVYKMSDRPHIEPWEEPFGLVRLDGSRRPAYDALKAITGLFGEVRAARWDDQGDYAVVTLEQDDKTTTALWNWTSTELAVQVAAIAPVAEVIYGDSPPVALMAEDGVYRLVLPPAACGSERCDIGGQPLFLVEQGAAYLRGRLVPPTATAPPTRTLLPTDAPTPTASLTVRPAATQPPTLAPSVTPRPTEPGVVREASLADESAVEHPSGFGRAAVVLAVAGILCLVLLLGLVLRRL